MKHTSLRLAAAAATATAIALLTIGAPPAMGAPNPTPTGPASLVDPAAGVQLDIHKFLGIATDPALPNNGTQQTVGDATHIPLAGVKFDVYQVFYNAGSGMAGRTNPVDLTTNAGWTAAAAVTGHILTQAEITAGQFVIGATTYYLGTQAGSPVTTGTDGTASFNKSAGAGLYLVNENLPASGTSIQQCPTPSTCTAVATSQVSASYPFFVTLPMTNPDTLNTWMYQVHAYPKNQQDTATKTVADQGTQTLEGPGKGGSHDITFTIITSITDGMTVAQMNKYIITDTLDPRLGAPVVTVSIDADGDPLTTGDRTALLPADYAVTGNVVITLTTAGITKLVAANTADAAATVVTTITAPVLTEGTGTITNQAYVMPNQAWFDANPGNVGTPTNATPADPGGVATLTKYGDLRITKAAVPAAAAALLVGAEFAVYLDATPLTGCTATDVTTTGLNPVIATATTDATATATIMGLQTSDFYNGAPQAALQQYCLVETKAPSGYNLNPEAIQFTILYGTATPSVPAFQALTVNNEKANLGNNLPLTGGDGVTALSIGGLLLVVGGLAYYLVTSRRRRHENVG